MSTDSTQTPSAPSASTNPGANLEAGDPAIVAQVTANLGRSATADLRGGKKKRKRGADEDDADDAELVEGTYRWYGRNLARSLGPFARVHPAVEYAVSKALANSDDEAHTETAVQKRLNENWDIIKNTIPGFSEEMIGLGGNRALRKTVCAQIQRGLNGARGDDANSIKRALPEYIAKLEVLSPPPPADDAPADAQPKPAPLLISANGTKGDRGWVHPRTARLNCPIKHPANAATYALIQDGQIVVLGTEIPYFMYRDWQVIDFGDLDDGLLEGRLLMVLAKHIYQGPSTALGPAGSNRGKAGNAALNGITSLTPRDIAYLAVQLRFSLSSQSSWNNGVDGKFSYEQFYWKIVKLLQGEESQEIIERFNQHDGPGATGAGDFDLIEAQRAAKRARKLAAASAAASTSSPST
ncbi:hypothetical protein C8R43DRAFT_964029 [Mycena crocata]|nr:hypothetical protein C8R43DRAFT_964029 [Mycena crocata]